MTRNGHAPLITFGPRVRRSPYFDATRRYGAKSFTIYNHMYMPTGYTDPVSEYWHLVNDVTLWDVACERQIEVTGPDAAKLVQLLVPRDLTKLDVEQCWYVLMTADDGGIVNDAVLLRLGENHFWLSPADGDVLLWAQGIAINAGLDVSICEPDVSPLQLQGPKAPPVARSLFGDLALELKYYRLKETEFDGIPVVLARTGWSGEIGYEIYLRDSQYGDKLWETIMEAGRKYNIAPIAPSTIRSIEGRILSYGSDIRRQDNPYTLDFDRFVDLDHRADFIGKAALKRIKAEGVKRRLVGVEIDGPPLSQFNEDFWPVWHSEQHIGHITRCAHSPRLEKNVGLANVPVDRADIDTKLFVTSPSGDLTATVVRTPFFKSQRSIPALTDMDN